MTNSREPKTTPAVLPKQSGEWQAINTTRFGRIYGWIPSDNGDGRCMIIYRDHEGQWRNDNDDLLAPDAPTLWQPLPAGPSPQEA